MTMMMRRGLVVGEREVRVGFEVGKGMGLRRVGFWWWWRRSGGGGEGGRGGSTSMCRGCRGMGGP